MLLTVADAVRHRRPASIRYAGRGDRTPHPYGVVAHAGRSMTNGSRTVPVRPDRHACFGSPGARSVVSGPVVGAEYSPIHSSFHDGSYACSLHPGR